MSEQDRAPMPDVDHQWFFCLKHHRVEQGQQCPARNRLGPYATEAEAAHALERVAERNDEWDEDPRWQ
ncbi:hypothetical protein [Streptacidiphilus monticola]|jgi:hypothetical protein|uniref:SPOR domain-containing protein n=1 Tax=Streptacidiphilus monticola TaxID=2161674 RepID=A0ABW1FWF6_9ACTN